MNRLKERGKMVKNSIHKKYSRTYKTITPGRTPLSLYYAAQYAARRREDGYKVEVVCFVNVLTKR
jgi:hypothetical protein